MHMPDSLTARVARWARGWLRPDGRYLRLHDQAVTNNSGDIVILRYNVLDLGPLRVRLHRIIKSDHDRDLHTHPWHNVTWVLDGLYYELIPADGYQVGEPYETHVKVRQAGDLVARGPSWAHRLLLAPEITIGDVEGGDRECLTLFVHWNWKRGGKRWGFWNAFDGSYRLAKRNS